MNDVVLKENDVFLVCGQEGTTIRNSQGQGHHGLYSRDTRFLSRLDWWLDPEVHIMLDKLSENGYEIFYWYTNTPPSDISSIPRESLWIERHQWVDATGLYEHVKIKNYALDPLEINVGYVVDADFVDMFEVRGFKDTPFQREVQVVTEKTACSYQYSARDGRITRTHVTLDAHPNHSVQVNVLPEENGTTARRYQCKIRLLHQEQVELFLKVKIEIVPTVTNSVVISESCIAEKQTENDLDQYRWIRESYAQWFNQLPQVTGDLRFAAWYEQGLKDLRMLQSNLGYGTLLTAGVPWYAVPFGRDSLIAARMMLLANPELARGTLQTMAHFQGTQERPEKDEQPGKIVHEVRDGELSRLGILPFAPYYGSVDATPLFLNLAADYLRWTGDEELLEILLPHVHRALDWIERYGDRDGDGFLEYCREAEDGIANQGWKDSGDSIMYADGRLVEGPVALCEVQAYLYRAYLDWAQIFMSRGEKELATRLQNKASELQKSFRERFILSDGSIALALDGMKQPCAVISSNMGQVLQSLLLSKVEADRVAARITAEDMLTGFGIRTLSSKEKRYNPLSYHNGSVWPHDTCLVLQGLRNYSCRDEAVAVMENLLRAQDAFDLHRLPELFAGFGISESAKPVPYPVSCSPQAWAAATPVFVLEQIIGLRPNASRQQIALDPLLPDSIKELKIERIPLGHGHLSLNLKSLNKSTQYDVVQNTTGWEVLYEPMAREVMAH
ncbi:amylo-alpha-1,6-glucosidase [Alicyclobacillus tolerans]|uniref:Glycogen debranching enzyme n=1 Tax=Alicyclobacillus tolerans TaxID=90970 RepID=A0ABT9LY10_9BACL|nr:glycogen debranching N-terminal domain-containing protein [Alicyclobacillus tengchongensis]MDP9729150.1 glycogen debranching enzyme [Alicyclobacillus tengchongensis]